MNKVKRIFLDLDDVLNKFTMAALHHVGCPVSRDDFKRFPVECGYNIIGAANTFFGKDSCKFYDRYEFWTLFGEEFWASLPVSDEKDAFMKLAIDAVGYKNTYILTSATGVEGCLEGKRKWIINNLGWQWVTKLITCKDKFVCANEYSILIDDSYENIRKFRDYRGRAILVPRPWNLLNHTSALTHVKAEITRIMKA